MSNGKRGVAGGFGYDHSLNAIVYVPPQRIEDGEPFERTVRYRLSDGLFNVGAFSLELDRAASEVKFLSQRCEEAWEQLVHAMNKHAANYGHRVVMDPKMGLLVEEPIGDE